VIDPIPEIFWLGDFAFFHIDQVFDEAVDAEEAVIFRQFIQAVLERVFHEFPFVEDLRVAVIALLVLFYHPSHEGEDVLITGKYDVGSTNVEREPFIHAGPAESASLRFRFENDDLLAPFMEKACNCKTDMP
jgi:hypothetical protein